MEEYQLTDAERKVISDIKIRAIMFDMDIDWETLCLVPKQKIVSDPRWLANYKDKREQSDNNPDSPKEADLE